MSPRPTRHAGRHRLPHDDDQRPRRARLGRRRDRGGGGDARPADLDAAAAGDRLQAHRRAAGGRHGHRPGADRDRDAAREGRRRQVRRVLRPRDRRLGLADRATIGNMSPEFGSTCAIFPIDAETLRYLEFTGRPTEQIELVDAYTREQGLFHEPKTRTPPTATPWSSTSATSSRASPGPSVPRTGSPSPTQSPPSSRR